MKAKHYLAWLVLISAGAVTTGCSSTAESAPVEGQVIRIDGSSTVYPVTLAIAEQYTTTKSQKAPVEVSFSGTGDSFRKFCAGETVVNNASRPISEEEMRACSDAKIRYFELPIGFDAITIVVNPQNSWAADITVEELKTAWSEASQRQVTT